MNSAKPPPPPPHRPGTSRPPPPTSAADLQPPAVPAAGAAHRPRALAQRTRRPPHPAPLADRRRTLPRRPRRTVVARLVSRAPHRVRAPPRARAGSASRRSPSATGAGDAHPGVGQAVGPRSRTSLLARPLREGEAPPPGTRAAVLVLFEPEPSNRLVGDDERAARAWPARRRGRSLRADAPTVPEAEAAPPAPLESTFEGIEAAGPAGPRRRRPARELPEAGGRRGPAAPRGQRARAGCRARTRPRCASESGSTPPPSTCRRPSSRARASAFMQAVLAGVGGAARARRRAPRARS